MLDRVVRHYRISEIITSDRDKIFTNKFWQTLIAEVGTKLKLSIVYYPQTDGQTEKINQTLEIYLRCYVNHNQKNWIRLLFIAQLTLNNRTATATEELVFFANYGRHPNMFNTLRKSPQAEAALEKVSQLKQVHEEISKNIEYQQKRSESNTNKKKKRNLS